MTNIGTILKLFRLTNDLKVSKVSENIGISTSHICDIEAGRRLPSLTTLEKLAIAYNVPPSVIYEIKERANLYDWSYKKTFLEVVKCCLSYDEENIEKGQV